MAIHLCTCNVLAHFGAVFERLPVWMALDFSSYDWPIHKQPVGDFQMWISGEMCSILSSSPDGQCHSDDSRWIRESGEEKLGNSENRIEFEFESFCWYSSCQDYCFDSVLCIVIFSVGWEFVFLHMTYFSNFGRSLRIRGNVNIHFFLVFYSCGDFYAILITGIPKLCILPAIIERHFSEGKKIFQLLYIRAI